MPGYPYSFFGMSPYDPFATAVLAVLFTIACLGALLSGIARFLGPRQAPAATEVHHHHHTERETVREVTAPAATKPLAVGNTRPAVPEWAQIEQGATVTASASDLMRERPAKVYQIPKGNRPERIAGPDRRQIGS